jgi:hypothetical protein
MAGGLDLSNSQAAIQGKTEFSSFRGLTRRYLGARLQNAYDFRQIEASQSA